MLNGGKDEAAVLQALEISEAAFVAGSIRRWLKLDDVETLYIEPGSPWKNGYAESFPSRLRDEFLAIEEFESLRVARRLSTQWQDYNNQRPHSALSGAVGVERDRHQKSGRARTR